MAMPRVFLSLVGENQALTQMLSGPVGQRRERSGSGRDPTGAPVLVGKPLNKQNTVQSLFPSIKPSLSLHSSPLPPSHLPSLPPSPHHSSPFDAYGCLICWSALTCVGTGRGRALGLHQLQGPPPPPKLATETMESLGGEKEPLRARLA